MFEALIYLFLCVAYGSRRSYRTISAIYAIAVIAKIFVITSEWTLAELPPVPVVWVI